MNSVLRFRAEQRKRVFCATFDGSLLGTQQECVRDSVESFQA